MLIHTEQLIKMGLQLPPSWNLDTNIGEVRDQLDRQSEAQESDESDPPTLQYTEEDRSAPVLRNTRIMVRVYKPLSIPADGCPGMIMCHGGGFCVGNLDSGARVCRAFAKLGGVAVNVGYGLAPEHPYPTAIHDCSETLCWVLTFLALI